MGLLNEQPHKLEEYVKLKFEMKTFEKRFARATVLTEKLELQSQWEKYCEMEPVYEKVKTALIFQTPAFNRGFFVVFYARCAHTNLLNHMEALSVHVV